MSDKMNKNTDENNKNVGLFKFIINVLKIFITIVLLFFALVVIIQRVTNNKNSFLGFRIFRVETGSMIPKYSVGDVILAKEKDIDKIKVGDDLVYEGNYGSVDGKIITHRLIRIEEENGEKVFYTKGIANSSEDPAVSSSQIRGVVIRKVFLLSLLFSLLYDTFASYFIIVIPITLYVSFCLVHKALRKSRKERDE